MPVRPLNLLLLCDYQTAIAATVRDHILALETHSRHRYHRLSMLGDIPPALDLTRFDGIVIHYTLFACSDSYLSPASRARLAAFTGLKAMYIQDEYRVVDASIAAMREVGINLLFTCVPEGEFDKVYSPTKLPGVAKVNVFTGYVPENLARRKVPPTAERPIDIGYRGRNVPAWLGRLGQEKQLIGMRMAEDAPRHGLVTDISFREEDRLYGDAWVDFVLRCKAMLGVESGASVFDFTGDIQRNVERHLWHAPDATFDELHDRYFAEAEGRIDLAQISPRCFEAAALRTLMILYEGNYSGVLQPWRHYVPLRKDHSNTAEVVAVLRDPGRMTEITERAYEEIALNPRYSFAHAVSETDQAIEAALRPEMLSTRAPYPEAEFLRAAAPDLKTRRRLVHRQLMHLMRRLIFAKLLGNASAVRRERVEWRLRHIYGALLRRAPPG
jgi:hypothetical protein